MLESNISAPLINLIVKTISSKIEMKKKDFKISKNTRLILSYQTQLGYTINPELYYKVNIIKIKNV